jgi:hypothetical protein
LNGDGRNDRRNGSWHRVISAILTERYLNLNDVEVKAKIALYLESFGGNCHFKLSFEFALRIENNPLRVLCRGRGTCRSARTQLSARRQIGQDVSGVGLERTARRN